MGDRYGVLDAGDDAHRPAARRAGLDVDAGHTTRDPAGPRCYCGQRGCVETYISGSGLEHTRFEATGFRLSAQEIFAVADAGEPAYRTLMERFFDAFGRALANLIAEVAKRVCSNSLETPILRNRVSDSSGVIGAALRGV